MASRVEGIIHPDLVMTGVAAKHKDEVIRKLATLLREAGCVTEGYAAAVSKSEYMFPTGLSAPDMPVAIPHTEGEHCLKSGIAVATLERPIRFNQMTRPHSTLNVGVVFLLCFADSNEQIEWHKRLAIMFQRPGALKLLIAAPDAETCCDILRRELSTQEATAEEGCR